MKKFGANKVISEKIKDIDLSAYAVGYDLDEEGKLEYRLNSLVKLLMKVIPEFAFGHHNGDTIPIEDTISLVAESACAIYKIDDFKRVKEIYIDDDSYITDDIEDKYLRRGEFGELILHLLLRDFYDTVPLLSKIYFKDSDGHTVHGFDAIHINPEQNSIWLGESKLYTSGVNGVDALIKDLEEHIEKGYMNREFALISKKLKILDNISEKEHWLNILDEATTLKDKFDSITIPLLCTYSSDLYATYADDTLPVFIEDFKKEIQLLKKRFDDKNQHKMKQYLNIILILFPVKCKNELVKNLHKKLTLMQEMGKDD